ncbi:hypothetical protein [Lacimicrobium sp. SS2-24]|uniref:hypothetical protein n=1 Tax=Lacimicrobium sp. SS2-24 TaxID=2005569 RepID=UPI000B4B7077|nr:hypothetical protein [Lacimicrobium sp. SS2-24]
MKKPIVVVLWIVSLMVAFLIGRFTEPQHFNSTSSAYDQQTEQAPQQTVRHNPDSAIAPPEKHKPATDSAIEGPSDDVNGQALIERLKLTLATENGERVNYGQLGQAYNTISQLTEAELTDALQYFEPIAALPAHRSLLAMMLTRYSQFNAQEAMAYLHRNVKEPLQRLSHATTIMSEWSRQNPQAAYDWFVRNKDAYSPYGGQFPLSLFKGLAAHDRYDAMDKLNGLSLSRNELHMAVKGITDNLNHSGELIELIDLAQLEGNSDVAKALVSDWASQDPRSASQWLTTSTLNNEGMQRTVLFNWMVSKEAEMNQAADWFMRQSPAGNIQKSINMVMDSFAMTAPEAGMSWLDQTDYSDRDSALSQLIERAVFRHPDFSMTHLDKIQSEEKRLETAKRVYRGLMANNPRKAEQFAAQSPYKAALESETVPGMP